MVYPVYLLFIEHGVHGAVQGLSGLQVMPKGLLDNYPQPSPFLAPKPELPRLAMALPKNLGD